MAENCPQLSLTVSNFPGTQVSADVIAPVISLLGNVSGEATVVDHSQNYPTLTLHTPQYPSISFFAVEGVSDYRLVQSGIVLNDRIDFMSGYLETLINNKVIGVSGVNAITGAVYISGIGGTLVTVVGNTIFISGGGQGDVSNAQLQATGTVLNNRITLLQQAFEAYTGNNISFRVNVPVGIDTLHVVYPRLYSSAPVAGPFLSVTGDLTYLLNADSFTTSGFTARFSDIIAEGGATLNTIVKPLNFSV